MENLEFIEDIESYAIVEKITEGCSGDDKYLLEKNGKLFLLRVGDKDKSEEKKREYNRLEGYVYKGVNTHKPIAFGTTSDRFYSIVSWVDGIPVMDVIKKDVSKDYYQLGRKVGSELKKLHTVSANTPKVDWRDIIQKRAVQFLDNYHHLNIAFPGSKKAEQFILNHYDLISDRPQVYLHGDFHWNNCVVNEKGKVGIIDFSGNEIGDPWYDFGGLLWALEYSESFANGQIDGYFGTPPEEFWGVFKLYVALYAFEHFMYSDGTFEDIQMRIGNARRMLSVYGEEFELNYPLFRRYTLK